MPHQLHCPKGHRWSAAAHSTTSVSTPCPVCGLTGSACSEDALPPFVEPPTAESKPALPAIPGYEMLEILGRGGMGMVFKARQHMPPRLVALKMIKEGLFASPTLRQRFRQEVEAVARLRHPNIIPILQVGEHEGCPYFTMEYLDGGTLHEKLGGAPQPADVSSALVETLARAMHAAHEQHVIHRDLKPSNILLSGDILADCVPKIADFGLAKIDDGAANLTPTQAVLGTVGYMAPEQAAGKSGTIGPAADVYGLGAVLYQMLTGRPPFAGESNIDLLLRVVRDDPVPPRRLLASIPPDLETICLACLEKEPAKRYGSALELADELRRFRTHEPIKRRPVGAAGKVVRWSRRNPALAFAGGLTVAALLIITILSIVFGFNQAQLRKLAERNQAINLLERGQTLAAKDEHGEALLAFTHGLEVLPPDEAALERVLRLNMGASLARHHQLLDLFPEDGSVHSVVFGPDEKSLITSNHDGNARIWDLATGKPRLLPHADPVWSAELSPDGNLIATCAGDTIKKRKLGAAAVWDRTGEHLFSLPHAPADVVWSAGFTRDGRHVITGAQDANLRAWDVKTGEKVTDLKPDADLPQDVEAFRFARSADGKHLATAHGPVISFWNLPGLTSAGAQFAPLKWQGVFSRGPRPEVVGLMFNARPPAPTRFLTVTDSKEPMPRYVAQVWDWPDLKPRGTGIVRRDWMRSAHLSADGTMILIGCRNGEVLLCDVDGNNRMPPIRGADRALFHPSEKLIFCSTTTGGHIELWDRDTAAKLGGPIPIGGSPEGKAFSRDGTLLALGGDKAVGLWRLKMKAIEELAVPHADNITEVAFHPDGKSFLTAAGRKLTVHSTATGEPLHEFTCDHPIATAAFGRNGSFAVCGCSEGGIVRFGLDGVQRKPIEHKAHNVRVDPGKTMLACISAHVKNEVVIWDLESGAKLRNWRDGDESLTQLAFTDSETIVTGSWQGNLKAWNALTGSPRAKLLTHNASVSGIVVHRNLLAVSFADLSVRIIDWQTGAEIGPPLPGTAGHQALAFVDDGRILVTAGGTVMLWDLATRRPVGPPWVTANSVQALSVSPDGRLICPEAPISIARRASP